MSAKILKITSEKCHKAELIQSISWEDYPLLVRFGTKNISGHHLFRAPHKTVTFLTYYISAVVSYDVLPKSRF